MTATKRKDMAMNTSVSDLCKTCNERAVQHPQKQQCRRCYQREYRKSKNYRDYELIGEYCIQCQKNWIMYRENKLCINCYNKNRSERLKKSENGVVCTTCNIRKVTKFTKKKICNTCYQREYRKNSSACSVAGCSSLVENRKYELCAVHSRKKRLEGKSCRGLSGKCGRVVERRGLCHTHALHDDKGFGINLDIEPRMKQPEECFYEGCTDKPYTWGVCRGHETDYWRETNPESFYKSRGQATHTRRLRLSETDNDKYTEYDVISHWGEFCYLCGDRVAENYFPIRGKYNTEHVHPLSRGGTHTIDNLRPSCRKCNRDKGTKTLTEYLKKKFKK